MRFYGREGRLERIGMMPLPYASTGMGRRLILYFRTCSAENILLTGRKQLKRVKYGNEKSTFNLPSSVS